jgi:hypothetical protein
MEINKPLITWIIVLALVVVGLVYRTAGQPLPGQAPPEETASGQTDSGQPLPGQTLETGTLTLYLCDAPLDAENVAGVYITINEIQYHRDDQWTTCEEFVGPQTCNLLELTGGNSLLLGELTLPVGKYTQIRFMLDIPEKGSRPSSPGCYIEFVDNSTEPLFAPGGGETGYKATGQFEVTANGTVVVTADFDVRKGVVLAGSSYILKPTIKLTVLISY